MFKKHLIVAFLLLTYTILLGHNIVPHEHFDDLFSKEHSDDSHRDSDHNHHYPFSHSIALHSAIEKQNIIIKNPVKRDIKKSFSYSFIHTSIQVAVAPVFCECVDSHAPDFKPANGVNTSLFCRPPPAVIS